MELVDVRGASIACSPTHQTHPLTTRPRQWHLLDLESTVLGDLLEADCFQRLFRYIFPYYVPVA